MKAGYRILDTVFTKSEAHKYKRASQKKFI